MLGCIFMKIYTRKHLGILLHFFYFKKIKLYLYFAFRGTISSKILTSREKLWNNFYSSMLFWNYNICTYGGSIHSILLFFLVFTSRLRKLPYKTGRKTSPSCFAVLSQLSHKKPLKTIDIAINLTFEHQSNNYNYYEKCFKK